MTTKPNLVIWGASGHARVVADVVRLAGQYQIAGFLDDGRPERYGTAFCGAPILGGGELLPCLKETGIVYVILAVGDCTTRLRLAETARRHGFQLATAVHPGAIVAADVQPGPGSVVAAGAVINPGAEIGQNVIVNTAASVDHDCMLADGVHIGPGVRLAGEVRVGRASQVGIGAVVVNGVRIGAGSLVGAGAVVVDDVPDRVVAYGVPARVIRPNEQTIAA
jgi:UDP-N-acetylbacillosamine N-acetyltransferase